MRPHKHAETIKAWADGAEIQVFDNGLDDWIDAKDPYWNSSNSYRIKPQPIIYYTPLVFVGGSLYYGGAFSTSSLKELKEYLRPNTRYIPNKAMEWTVLDERVQCRIIDIT